MPGPGIDLYKPDMEQLEEEDYPFSLVLEQRSSIREYAANPVTDRKLGEFLYRTARVKEMIKSDLQNVSKRPYPGGGAIYELELYVNVNARGRMQACFEVGEMEDLRSLAKIRTSPEIRACASVEALPEECRRCPHVARCAGGCRKPHGLVQHGGQWIDYLAGFL